MHSLHGMKKEEGLIGFLLLVHLEKFEAFFQEDLIDFLQVKIRRDHARTVIPGVRMLGQRPAINDLSRRNGYAVAVYISI